MKTAEENNADLIALLERVIAEVREYGAITAKWEIEADARLATAPYRYRIDTVINRDVDVTVDFPFWRSMKANGAALSVLRDLVALADDEDGKGRADEWFARSNAVMDRARALVAEHTTNEETT